MSRYLIAALIVCALVIWGGWQKIQGQATELDTATDTITRLEAAAKSRKNTQRLLLELDTKHTQELTHAQKTNADLRAAVAAGQRRLSIAARCPAVRTATSTTGLDDGATRADIDPAAAERVVAITIEGDTAIRQLIGLQDYITQVCRTPK